LQALTSTDQYPENDSQTDTPVNQLKFSFIHPFNTRENTKNRTIDK
jgi:hypothetical protein